MNQINIVNDVSIITKVPNKILNDLISKSSLCIGSAIKDAVDRKDETLLLNIGIGTLSINLLDMQCKFMPGAELKATIKKSLKNGIDPLEKALEQTVVDKLIKIYKEEA